MQTGREKENEKERKREEERERERSLQHYFSSVNYTRDTFHLGCIVWWLRMKLYTNQSRLTGTLGSWLEWVNASIDYRCAFQWWIRVRIDCRAALRGCSNVNTHLIRDSECDISQWLPALFQVGSPPRPRFFTSTATCRYIDRNYGRRRVLYTQRVEQSIIATINSDEISGPVILIHRHARMLSRKIMRSHPPNYL